MVGVVAAGLEHVSNVKPPQEILLQFVGKALQIEHQNTAMNEFVAKLIDNLRKKDVYTLLVKGQGVAQCYIKPLWRTSGDIDLYLSDSNYKAAKEFLTPLASHVDGEDRDRLHQGMTIDSWVVELHGTMYSDFSKRMNKVLDEVHQSIFHCGEVRSWDNNGVSVFLPSADNDVIIVFTHFIQHFYVGGIGLRQICDWCRLLWSYRSELDLRLLESRIREAGLVTEWRTFGSMAVDVLGMPKEAMPMYDSRYHKRGQRVLARIMKSGNMGHNNDLSYRAKYSGLTYKLVALWRRLKDFAGFTMIFPIDAPKFFVHYVFRKI